MLIHKKNTHTKVVNLIAKNFWGKDYIYLLAVKLKITYKNNSQMLIQQKTREIDVGNQRNDKPCLPFGKLLPIGPFFDDL